MSHLERLTIVGFLLLVGLMLSPNTQAQAETPLDMLKRVEVQNPLPPAKNRTAEEICAERESNPSSGKCRGYYISNGYVPEWRGADRSQIHPVLIEGLTRGDDAAVCYAVIFLAIKSSMDEWSPCTDLQRSR